MSEKILIVDDEPNILEDFRRQLKRQFRDKEWEIQVDTALSGEDGLQAIEVKGPYAVVVSDMKMPGMDGVEFLSRVREKNPDTVRVMLTGQPSMDTAIDAVNEGRIFRFLTKPCPPESLNKVLMAGIKEFRLVKAERKLLEKALDLNKPVTYALHPNVPNPFHGKTTIPYDMKEAGIVTIKVFDLMGEEVTTLVQKAVSAGFHEVIWDATDAEPGTYLCKMETEGFAQVKRFLLVESQAS
ncbi:response regulator [bacterium]|nr:response regulator [bacterium]